MFDEAEFPDPAWGDLDWLSEEKYNLMKEKYNNMPSKKKKKQRRAIILFVIDDFTTLWISIPLKCDKK